MDIRQDSLLADRILRRSRMGRQHSFVEIELVGARLGPLRPLAAIGIVDRRTLAALASYNRLAGQISAGSVERMRSAESDLKLAAGWSLLAE